MRYPFDGKFTVTMTFNQPCSWFKGGKHPGVDWACPKGTPMRACFDGTVKATFPFQLNSYGREVILVSTDGQFEALYGHFSEISCKIGDKVKIGDVIGASGNSGYVISLGGGGYHLHFGLKKNGVWVDPLKYCVSPDQLTLKIPVKDETEKVQDDNQSFITTGYVVKRGDSLSSIALDFYNNANLWKKIFVANQNIIKDPNKIYRGQVLKIPGFS